MFAWRYVTKAVLFQQAGGGGARPGAVGRSSKPHARGCGGGTGYDRRGLAAGLCLRLSPSAQAPNGGAITGVQHDPFQL